MAEYYYYTSSNDQDYNNSYPVNNYPYYNQPYIDPNQNSYSYYSSSYGHGYGGYSNEQPVRYDQYYDTQIHGNPYQHLPTQSLIVYHNNSAYDHPEFAAKKGSEFPDLGSTTGFVVSDSNTEPQTDLEFEEYNPEPFRGGYNMTETYGKPLPPSEEICYPPSKIDPTPPPASPFGKGEQNAETPAVKEEEQVKEDHQDSEPDEHDEEEEEEQEEEEEEQAPPEEEENRGVLIAPPLPGKEEQSLDKGDSKPTNESHVHEEAREEEQEQASKPKPGEEEEEGGDLGGGGDEGEKEIIRRQIPPGCGLEALDLCEGVFGGYFPCLRKRNQVNFDQSNGDPTGDCWKSTMDYLFGDPDPYARAMPDPIYGYQRYYPKQPLYEQVEYRGDYTCAWSDNPSYYGYCNYNGGYQ